MITVSTIKKQLENIYGDDICCRITNGYNVQYDIQERYKTVDMAICIHESREIAVVWNLRHRRFNGSSTHVLSLSESWDNLQCKHDDIVVKYKTFKTPQGLCYEKVLIIGLSAFFEVEFDLMALLQFDRDDEEIPLSLKQMLDNENEEGDISRVRISTSRWKREQIFRKKVLASYENQCVVCRCSETCILEAAHIVAVADGGADALQNGICLCANHHKMLDRQLIKISPNRRTLLYAADSVKSMAWYNEFWEKYGGLLKERIKLKEA